LSRAWPCDVDGVRGVESPAPSPDVHEVVIAVEGAQLERPDLDRPLQIPGVAAIGRVVAAGDQALALLDQRVLVGSIDPCGQCEVCRRGGGTVCPQARHRGRDTRGTLAERITVAAKWVVPMGGELGLDRIPGATADDAIRFAALAGDAALAYTAYARSDLAPKDPAVLLGRTSLTRFLVEILLAKGLAPVVLVEQTVASATPDPWTTWLTAHGARVAHVRASDDLAQLRLAVVTALAAESSNRDAVGVVSRPWKLIATEPRCLLRASGLAGPRATVTVIAGLTGPASDDPATTVDPSAWHREVTIQSVTAASPELMLETAALAVRGQLDLAAGVTVLTIEEFTAARRAGLHTAVDPTQALVVRIPVLPS
jgi:NADPH:quinone reductase-like Zn-dependent oxidoreductase